MLGSFLKHNSRLHLLEVPSPQGHASWPLVFTAAGEKAGRRQLLTAGCVGEGGRAARSCPGCTLSCVRRRISLLSTQNSCFSFIINAYSGILFRSSICFGAQWGFSSAQPEVCRSMQLWLCNPNGRLKPHRHEQHCLAGVYASKGQLLGTSRGCEGPCVQAGSFPQASLTPVLSLGGCSVLPFVGQASS